MLLAFAFVAALLLAAFIFLFPMLASRATAEAFTAEWLDSFSLENYAPMERLLNRSDFEFLASQPGYRPEIARRLLSERRRVFAGYLQCLIRDFNQLYAAAKLMVVYSQEDLPEFAKALWRQQIAFYYAVSILRCKVAIYPWGWTGVNVSKLAQPLESLRIQIQRFAQSAGTA